MNTPTVPELYDACTVLFGPEINVSFEFLRYLQPAGVTAAYRQRARETHPDRAVVIGETPESLTALFRDVRQAYEKLNAVIGNDAYFRGVESFYTHQPQPAPEPPADKREKSRWSWMASGFHTWDFHRRPQGANDRPSTPPPQGSEPPPKKTPGWGGYIPNSKLLFGQYLYYAGHIDWNALISSVVWQQAQRPLVGKLAVNWKLVSEEQVREILLNRRPGEKFGSCAVRLGKLTDPNVQFLLWKQMQQQKPIGHYFIEKGLLSEQQVDQLAQEARCHNAQVLRQQKTCG